MANTIKRRIYVSHEENMRYWGGKLPTWRNGFCHIERAVTPVKDADGIWDDCAQLKTPSGVVVIVDGDDIVSTVKERATPTDDQFLAALGPCGK